jgi:hypothetical protein
MLDQKKKIVKTRLTSDETAKSVISYSFSLANCPDASMMMIHPKKFWALGSKSGT